jgi:hypothetical protein
MVSHFGVPTTEASTRQVLLRMWGDTHKANSAESLITPRQSANGFPETGGGDGQEIYGLLPVATALTKIFNALLSKPAVIHSL